MATQFHQVPSVPVVNAIHLFTTARQKHHELAFHLEAMNTGKEGNNLCLNYYIFSFSNG